MYDDDSYLWELVLWFGKNFKRKYFKGIICKRNFTENEIIGISASGKLSKDGREYEFSVSGEAKYSDYKEIFK